MDYGLVEDKNMFNKIIWDIFGTIKWLPLSENAGVQERLWNWIEIESYFVFESNQ